MTCSVQGLQRVESWMPSFKGAIFPVAYGYSNIDDATCECLQFERTATAWYGSNLSADSLRTNGPSLLPGILYGWGLWLQVIWNIHMFDPISEGLVFMFPTPAKSELRGSCDTPLLWAYSFFLLVSCLLALQNKFLSDLDFFPPELNCVGHI